MPRIVGLALFLHLLYAGISAQPLLVTAGLPEPGDTLFYLYDELPSAIRISPSGQDQMWNFLSLRAPYLEMEMVQPVPRQPGVDWAITGRRGQRFQFRKESKGLYWVAANRWQVGKTMIPYPWTSESGRK